MRLVAAACRFCVSSSNPVAEIVGKCHRLTPPVVHRDLKPANVLMRVEGGRMSPLIADFGIGGVSSALELLL